MKPSDTYLDTTEIFARYSISKATFYRWLKDPAVGFPKPMKVRGRHYFREADLDLWDITRGASAPPEPEETVRGKKALSKVITTYDEFVECLRKRRQALRLSVIELDAKSGMQEGYSNKLENYAQSYGRGMGPETFPLWLGGLRVGIVLVDLPRRPPKTKITNRKSEPVNFEESSV